MDAVKDLKKRSVSELKDLCRAQGLPLSGTKDVLVKRLLPSSDHGDDGGPSKKARTEECAPPTKEVIAEWCQLKQAQLKDLVKERGLPVSGTVPQLLSRLATGKKHAKDQEEDLARGLGGQNTTLVAKFKAIAEEEEGFKAIAANRIATLFTYYPYKITSGAQCKKLKGVGKGTISRIDRFLEEMEEEEEAAASAPAAEEPKETSEYTTAAPEAELVADCGPTGKLQQVMMLDESEDGLTKAELVGKTGLSEDEISELLVTLSDEGRVYTTVDDDHYKLA